MKYSYSKYTEYNLKYYEIDSHEGYTYKTAMKIINYADLIGMPYNKVFGISNTETIAYKYIQELKEHPYYRDNNYWPVWLKLERNVGKELKKLGIIELEYKYKKKDNK